MHLVLVPVLLDEEMDLMLRVGVGVVEWLLLGAVRTWRHLVELLDVGVEVLDTMEEVEVREVVAVAEGVVVKAKAKVNRALHLLLRNNI
jgi:hypothetical protein